jgi:DNA helicase-2/ATP-dependent DNA helicase PcrA
MPGGELGVSSARERSGARDGDQARLFLRRPEVRDVLAWMRLLTDPQDAAAVVRALVRPPIELHQVELARVIQVARRRKLDLVAGLAAATESPQVPPEARERIQGFLELHRGAAVELDTLEPEVFIGRLIERLGARGRPLLAPDDACEQRASLERLERLAVEFARGAPRASARDLARHLAGVVPEARSASDAGARAPSPSGEPSVGGEIANGAEGGEGGEGGEQAYADRYAEEPDGELLAALRLLRGELLDGVARVGARLGELRLDTELDISHGVVRYLELLKVSALLQRPEGQSVADALADVNARLLAAATPLQREILSSSTLDEALMADGSGDRRWDAGDVAGARADALGMASREQHSLGPFLPRRGIGLSLSASDIQTYRGCPLRYKFARVLRIPVEQTVHQRFGIVVHQVLERYHREGGRTLAQLLGLLEACGRRAGFRDQEPSDRELLDKARVALTRYHARLESQDSKPVWFERQFDFRLGPHHLRGRVDRVDRLADGRRADVAGAGTADGEYELIDYKTSRPKGPEALREDVQLSLYALAARVDWGLESSRQAYYYVLDDVKVPVAAGERGARAVEDVVLEVGEGILAQEFEPRPSVAACSVCDYRIVCPAAEV